MTERFLIAEIVEAFRQRQGFSLLIKGNAGTGKTTIGLEVLVRGENPLYISTRVSPQSLYGQFPWCEKLLPADAIKDATNVLFPPSQNLVMEMQRMISFQGLPKFIEAIYHHVKEKKNVTAVIDSWDAVIKNDPEPRNEDKTITSLTELIRKINVNLILITEQNEPTFLDYLVDGILHLEDLDFSGRRLRLMTLKKMRGVQIRNKRYVYTLDKGRATVLAPRTLEDFTRGKSVDAFKPLEVNEGMVSSGNKNFDEIIKIPRGAAINFEIRKNSGFQGLLVPITMMIQNGLASPEEIFLENGGIINKESILAPFFKEGFLQLKAKDGSLTLNIFNPGRSGEDAMTSDIHLVIDTKEGIVFLFGENPYTKLFAIEPVKNENLLDYELIPVV